VPFKFSGEVPVVEPSRLKQISRYSLEDAVQDDEEESLKKFNKFSF